MKLVDVKCPKCGHVLNDIRLNKFYEGSIICECGGVFKKVFTGTKFRIINYSPEHAGGSDK